MLGQWRLMGLSLFTAVISAASAHALELDLPVACTIGKDCWVQQYPDHDKGPGFADYTCGSATYDGHDGTDFRSLDTTSDINVVAAADGTVKAIRNIVDDKLIAGLAGLQSVRNVECGNGVVVVHPGGYVTQYCHLRKGSVRVRAGQKVKSGDVLGLIGYSGAAQFPHVHLSVRKAGLNVDPFSTASRGTCADPDQSMWSAKAKAQLGYQPLAMLDFGWAKDKISSRELEVGQVVREKPSGDWPALLAYVWLINLEKGDTVTLSMTPENGVPAVNTVTMERSKAQYVLFAGKRRNNTNWSGKFEAEIIINNGNTEKLRRKIDVTVP